MPTPDLLNTRCAFVLKDKPTEYVKFESFPLNDGITEAYRAEYRATQGRAAEPYAYTWRKGAWEAITFQLQFRAGLSRLEVGPPAFAINRMLQKVYWLQAAAFPRTAKRPSTVSRDQALGVASSLISGQLGGAIAATGSSPYTGMSGQAAEPPYILFVWGLFMTLRGRIHNVSIRWVAPYDPISGKPHGAEVTLQFQPETGYYPNWWTIKDGRAPNSIVGRFV